MLHSSRQRILMLGSALMLVSAALIAFAVIPLAGADRAPGAAPDRAVPAFWAMVLLLLLVGAAALTSSRLGSNHATLRRALAGGPGLLAVILGLVLIDAAAARIKSAGGALLNEPEDRPWGARMFQFKDPDGFKLGVSTPLAG